MTDSKPRNALAMTLTGALFLLASVLYLLLEEDPFPMWLIMGGAGLLFISVGAAIRGQHRETTRQ